MRKYFFVGLFTLLGLYSYCQEYNYTYPDGIISSIDIFNLSMKQGVASFRIPALVTAKNGDLIAAIDERVTNGGDLKFNDDINILVRRSEDNGKSWSEMQTVVDFPKGKSASDPSMVVDEKTGEIFLFYNFMDLHNARNEYYLHYVKSKDNGKTWSEPIDITSSISKPEWKSNFKFITSGRAFYTSDDKIIHTLVNLESGLHIFGSDDHGESWYLIDTPIRPADESKIIELFDGRWMINSRVPGAGTRYVHISDDQGKSWKTRKEESLVDPACNASIVRYTAKADGYDKDRLLFCNAAHPEHRMNLAVKISYDNGETWSKEKVIFPGWAGYSSMTILDNGDIAVFFEKDGYTKNEVVVFSLEWLTDGADKYTKPSKKAKKKSRKKKKHNVR